MTGQNRSTAVMQRRIEPHNSLDDFPTPPWATRAVCEWLLAQQLLDPAQTCREPAANRGYMVRPLAELFIPPIDASDVHDYGAGFPVRDYLWGQTRSSSTGLSAIRRSAWRSNSSSARSEPVASAWR